MNIRLANLSDLKEINELYNEVIVDIHRKGISMWNDEYPFCEFEKDIKNLEMYVLEEDEKIIGSFAITDFDDTDYHVINWNYKNKRFIYLNRLAISTFYQGKGYSKLVMAFVEDFAMKNNYEVIRLTVLDKNKIAINLYEKLGFKKIENSYWNIGEKRFIGYEKEMKY